MRGPPGGIPPGGIPDGDMPLGGIPDMGMAPGGIPGLKDVIPPVGAMLPAMLGIMPGGEVAGK